jgi:hypothetical protein
VARAPRRRLPAFIDDPVEKRLGSDRVKHSPPALVRSSHHPQAPRQSPDTQLESPIPPGYRHLDDDLVLDGAPPRTLVLHPVSDRKGRRFVQVFFLQYLVAGRLRGPSLPRKPRPSLSVRATPLRRTERGQHGTPTAAHSEVHTRPAWAAATPATSWTKWRATSSHEAAPSLPRQVRAYPHLLHIAHERNQEFVFSSVGY